MNTTENVNINLNVSAESGIKSIRQIRQEIATLTKEMESASGDRQKALAAQIGQLRNDLKDVKAEMNAMDPGELLSGWIKFGQGAIGAFAGITGAMSLFGSENKKVQELEKKSMALIQTMMGLEAARQILVDNGAKAQLKAMFETTIAQGKQIALGLKVTATQALQTLGIIKQTQATEAAVVAQEALNKASKASLYAAMAAAVLYLADLYYTGWKRAQDLNDAHLQGEKIIADYTKNLQDLQDEMNSYITTLNGAITAYQNLGNTTLATNAEIFKSVNKVLGGAEIMMNSSSKAAQDLASSVVKIGASYNDFDKNAATQMVGKLYDLKVSLSNTDNAGRDVTEANKILKQAIDDVISGLGEEAKATEKATENKNKNTNATNKNTKSTKESTKALKDFNKEMDEFLSKKLDEALQKPLDLFTFDPESIKLYYQLRSENEALSEKERVDALIQLEEIRYNEELELAGEYAPAREEAERKHQMNLNKIRNQAREEEKEKSFEFKKWEELNQQEKIQRLTDYIAQLGNYINKTTDLILQFQSQAIENQLNEINKVYDQQKSQYDQLLEDNLISQEEYNDKTKILEEEKARKEKDLKHKAFEQERTAQIINATVQTLMAVLNAYSSGMAYPLIGPATAGVFAAIAGVFGAAQIAAIASEKNPYARGGLIPGKSHAAGGETINAEGGEVILNKRAMSVPVYRDLANMINTSTGGASIPSINGGVRSGSNNSGISADIPESTIDRIISRIASIPVIVSERDITGTQRRVQVIQTRTTI